MQNMQEEMEDSGKDAKGQDEKQPPSEAKIKQQETGTAVMHAKSMEVNRESSRRERGEGRCKQSQAVAVTENFPYPLLLLTFCSAFLSQ